VVVVAGLELVEEVVDHLGCVAGEFANQAIFFDCAFLKDFMVLCEYILELFMLLIPVNSRFQPCCEPPGEAGIGQDDRDDAPMEIRYFLPRF
jgi:hypothetical protein